MTPVFANSGSVQPAQGGEVACCSIAGGPFAAVDAYVSGGGGAQLEMRLYATVGTLRTLVATAPYSGPPVGAAGQGTVLEWTVINQPKATNPVVAGGTQYDLVAFGSSGAGAPIKCTLAGTNAYDTAVSASATVAAPSNFGSTTVATNVGCAQLADVGVDQAGVQACAFDVLVSCGAGSVEALVGTGTIGGNDGKADVIRQLPLPVGTQYRLAVRNTDGGRYSGTVNASLGTYNDFPSSGGAIPPSPSLTTADDGHALTLLNQLPTWTSAPNPVADGLNILNAPVGFAFLFAPSNLYLKTVVEDASTGTSRLTHLTSLPPNFLDLHSGFNTSIGPQVAEGRYRGFDGFDFTLSPVTELHSSNGPFLANPQPVTLIAVVSNQDAEGVIFSGPDGRPLNFSVGNRGDGTYVCFDDNLGHQITYPNPIDVRGISVLTWSGDLGTAGAFTFRINGVDQGAAGTAPTAPDGSNGFFVAGTAAGITKSLQGALEILAGWPTKLALADIQSAEKLFAQLLGVVRFPGFISDNGSILIPRSSTPFGASFAATRVQTTATALVAVYSGFGGVSSDVWVVIKDDPNGPAELLTTFNVPGDGNLYPFTVQLDGKSHIVEFWDSNQSFTEQATVCATLRELRGSYNLLPTADATTRISVYGNSITQGFYAGFVPPGGQAGLAGWWQLWRMDPTFAGRVSNIGSGGRTLHSDFLIDPTMAVLAGWLVSQAQEVVAGNRKTVWYGGIELNDWDQNAWDTPDFQTALAALVAQIHALDPNVFIVLQSSVVALNQANPNGFGKTLADYRTCVQNVANANTSFCVYVDGLAANNGVAALTLADLQDDVHPNAAGHIQYSAWAKATPALQYAYSVPLDGLVAWYEADQGVTLAAGNISALANFGRNGDSARNAINGTPATQPAAPAADGTLNGQLAIVFAEGGNGFLATGPWVDAAPNPMTIFFVGYASAGTKFFFDTEVIDANRVALYSNAGVPTLRVNVTDVATTGGVSATVPHVYCIVIDNANTRVDIYVDDMTTANVSDLALASGHPASFVLGNDNSHNFAQGGGFASWKLWNGALTQAERSTIAAQLKAKYGTP